MSYSGASERFANHDLYGQDRQEDTRTVVNEISVMSRMRNNRLQQAIARRDRAIVMLGLRIA